MRISNLQHLHRKTVLMRTRRQDIAPVLKPLHWLPVLVKFNFKILLLGFKHINGLGPFNQYDLFLHVWIFSCLDFAFELQCFSHGQPSTTRAGLGLPEGVLPCGLSGMGQTSAAPCHYSHSVGSSICPGRGGPCGGVFWG